MEKKVSGTRLKPWQAILLILAVAAFLFVAQFVLTGLQFLLDRSGLLQGDTAYTVASVLYWLLGGIAALYVLRNYILCYQYVWNTKQLSVFRLYGAGRPRNMVDIYFSDSWPWAAWNSCARAIRRQSCPAQPSSAVPNRCIASPTIPWTACAFSPSSPAKSSCKRFRSS